MKQSFQLLLLASLMGLLVAAAYAEEERVATPNSPESGTRKAKDEPRSEIEMACEAIGIDYDKLEHAALKGKGDALDVIVALHFDGGAADVWFDTKPRLLIRVPPEEATEALMKLAPKERKALITAMWESFRFHSSSNDSSTVEATFRQRYKQLIKSTKISIKSPTSHSKPQGTESK